jgi:hypothetical protein
MKKLQTIVAAAALLFATSAFANKGPQKVSFIVKNAFEKQFTGIKQVVWEQTEGIYFAYFKIDEKDVTVAYNEDGYMLGTSRVIANEQLPLSASLAIGSKYENYTVAKTAEEITFEGETSYYISVENEKQILKLKCLSNGDLSVRSKTKK